MSAQKKPSTNYPILSGIISFVGLSGMALLGAKVLVDSGFREVFRLVLDACTVISILASYMLVGWVGFILTAACLSPVDSLKHAWRRFLKNSKKLLVLPAIAVGCGVFQVIFKPLPSSILEILFAVLVTVPIAVLMLGGAFSVISFFLKRRYR